MIDPVKHGEFHFDPRRRQQGPLTSTAADPDAKTQFEAALENARARLGDEAPQEKLGRDKNQEHPKGPSFPTSTP